MVHKLSGFRKNRAGREVAFCSVCNKEVGVLLRPSMGGMRQIKKCAESVRMRASAVLRTERKKETRRRQRAAKRSERERQEAAAGLWRRIVYTRAEFKCELCGKECEPGVFGPAALHAHHIIKRSQSARLIIDPANGMAVCGPCHDGADRDQIRCLAFVEEREPGIAVYLLSERRIKGRIPFELEVARLNKTAAIYGIPLLVFDEEARAA